jgi:hypothetical protein
MRGALRSTFLIGLVAAATALGSTPVSARQPVDAAISTERLYATVATNLGTSDLFLLNAATGALAQTIGPVGFAVTGLAVHPETGVLYGATSRNSDNSPGSLITIDPDTGAGTLIGDMVPGSDEASADIDFGPDGTLYGIMEPGSDDIVTINLTTGLATFLGDAGESTFGSGLAFDTATGKLLWSGHGSDGVLLITDPATGVPVDGPTLTGTSSAAIAALEFGCDGTTLYGVELAEGGSRATSLVTIDEGTGAVTNLGPSVTSLDAIAAVCDQPTWIDGVYFELLNRRPDGGGRAFWASAIAAGSSPLAVARAVEGVAETRAAFVTDLYNRYLGRSPDPGGLQHFLGVTAAAGPLAARVSILASGEYLAAAGGTPNGFVNALYADVLGRFAGDADRAFWTGILASRGAGAVAGGILVSNESVTRIVTDTYDRLLHRAPDPGGLAHWRSTFAAGMDEHTLIVEILGSGEYFRRFPAVA